MRREKNKDATPDTPPERDDKADDLKDEREDLAAAIAHEAWKFKWEVRTYIVGMVLLVVFVR